MKIEYYPDTDTLSITFAAGPFTATKKDEEIDPEVLVLWDGERIGEIVIEGASSRIDLRELRRQVSFEEIGPEQVRPAA